MFEGAQSILLVKLSSIGDVVHSLPVLAAARRRFPKAHIAWAVGPAAADLVAGNPHLDEALVVGGDGPAGADVCPIPRLSSPLRLALALRERRFDLALDMQGLLKTALIAYLSGARDRVGFHNLQEGAFLFNNRRIVRDRRDVHAIEGYLGFANAIGAPAEPLDFTIPISHADRGVVDELLRGQRNLIALVPGARWHSKRWPAERFAEVADVLAGEFGATCAVVGGEGDRALAERIGEAARSEILDLSGRTTLRQLAEVLRRCRVAIANDTGPMHISAAVGTPTVAIFGPTDPTRLAPYGSGHAVLKASVPCAPCRRRECLPLRCLEAITVRQVVSVTEHILRPHSPGGHRGLA
jgi:lipopolysaccharide heptosyltransferase I